MTTGRPSVVAAIPRGISDDELLRLAGSEEQGSEHPYARAIVDAAKARGLVLARPEDVTVEPGVGITAKVEGRVVKIAARDRLAFTIASSELDALAAPAGASHAVVVDGALVGTNGQRTGRGIARTCPHVEPVVTLYVRATNPR